MTEYKYECSDCGKAFTEEDGTWPKYGWKGEPLPTSEEWGDFDDEWMDVAFVCYDCLGKRDDDFEKSEAMHSLD